MRDFLAAAQLPLWQGVFFADFSACAIGVFGRTVCIELSLTGWAPMVRLTRKLSM